MRYILYFLGSVLFLGCSVKTLPPVNSYNLSLEESNQTTSSKGCQEKTLKLITPYAQGLYKSDMMYYTVDKLEDRIYNQSKWSSPLYENVYNILLEKFRKAMIFKHIESSGSIAKSDEALEIEIDDFKQYYSKDLHHSYVQISIVLTLIDKKYYTVIAQKEFFIKEDAPPNAKGGVEALSNALNQLSQEMVLWLDEACNG